MCDDSSCQYVSSTRAASLSGLFCLALSTSILIDSRALAAQSLIERSFLLDIRQGSSRSERARSLSFGGYELEDGTPVDFERWYTPGAPEFNILFLTAATPSFGVTWGLSTGERGEKYRIDPGLWLGFVYRRQISPQSAISLSATLLLGGNFRERSCQAFYTITQTTETVNCRLAASVLPPGETLRFLERTKGIRESRATLRYEFRF